VGIWSTLIEPHWVEFRAHEVVIPGLPVRLDGLRVAHLTDIHASRVVPLHWVREVVERVNALEPDLVVITGDLVTEDTSWIDGVAKELGQLRAKHGRFAILGNHDYWTHGAAVSTALERYGVNHLRNTSELIGGLGGLRLLGIDDHWTDNDDLEAAMAGVGAEEPKLMLMHSPDLLAAVSSAGVHLALAGHTHGGQVRLPGWGALILPSEHGFEAGFYEAAGTRMYVNRGVGTLDLKVRMFCRPEVATFVLRTS
jgi:uncharacterized protein